VRAGGEQVLEVAALVGKQASGLLISQATRRRDDGGVRSVSTRPCLR
jgi:hypothetical protein